MIGSEIAIRHASSLDVDALWSRANETYVAAFGHTFLPEDLAAHLANNLSLQHCARMIAEDIVLFACLEQVAIGYVQFGGSRLEQRTAGDCDLRRLYVRQQFQNGGVGTALIEAALRHPLLITAGTIYLEVWEGNAGAQRLYRRHGFEVIGSRRFAVASGAPTDLELLMALRRARP